MRIEIKLVQGQSYPPTNRDPKYGPRGAHQPPYSAADLAGFEGGGNKIWEHSKVKATANIYDEKRGTGVKDGKPTYEITPEDVARLAAAGTPVGDIAWAQNGDPLKSSANDDNDFNMRVDVTGTPSAAITATCEGVTGTLKLSTQTPPFPTTKE